MNEKERSDTGVLRSISDRLLVTAVCLLVFWWPLLVGGSDSFRKGWTPGRITGVVILVSTTALGLLLVRAKRCERVGLAVAVTACSAGLVAFGAWVSSAWVHVPPDAVICVSMALPFAPFCFERRSAEAAVMASAASSFLLTFWLVLVRPY